MTDYTGEILSAYNTLGFTPRDNQLEIVNQIINSFIDEDYTNVILNAPTGSGKSILGMVVQLVMREIEDKEANSNIIMNTNVLIDQYNNSFSHLPLDQFFYRKGANNYPCKYMTEKLGYSRYGDATADLCIKDCDSKCPFSEKCEFNKIRKRQRFAKCIVSNYSYWMTLNLFSQANKKALINVFDECHTMNDVFSSFAAVEISTKLIDNILKMEEFLDMEGQTFPKSELEAIKNSLKVIEIKDEFDFSMYRNLTPEQKLKISEETNRENYDHFLIIINAIVPLLKQLSDIAENNKNKLDKEISSIQNEIHKLKIELNLLEEKVKKQKRKSKSSDKVNELKKTIKKLSLDDDILSEVFVKVSRAFSKIKNILFQIDLIKDDNEIMFEKNVKDGDYSIKAQPVFIKKYWKVMNNSKYNLFMSATITQDIIEKTIELKGKTKFIHIPSMFPKENKLIIGLQPIPLNYSRMQDINIINQIINKCEKVVHAHKDVSGIILTTAFELAHKIAVRLKNSPVTVFEHKQGEKIADILEKFKKCSTPAVLISPSLWEGISLDDDTSRYQIVCKTPYASLASKRNKFIQVRLPEIYQQQTLLTLIQGFGRSVRNRNDFCFTYCLDYTTIQEIQKPYNVWYDDFTYKFIN